MFDIWIKECVVYLITIIILFFKHTYTHTANEYNWMCPNSILYIYKEKYIFNEIYDICMLNHFSGCIKYEKLK